MPRDDLRLRDPFVLGTILATLANLALVWGHAHVAAQDHFNHLASMRALRGLWEGDPFFVTHFTVVRRAVPDLLAEAIWFVALRPLGEVIAGKALVSLYVVGLPLAWGIFLRRLCEGSTTMLPLASIATMSLYYSLGSTNYLLGLPLFLLGAVAWDRVREGPRAVVAFVAVVVLTWFAHVYDYVLLMIFVFAQVATRAAQRRPPTRHEWAAGFALLAGFALAARAVLSTESEWAASEPPRFDLDPRRLAHVPEIALFFRSGGGTRYAILALAAVAVTSLVANRSRRGGLRAAVLPAAILTLAALWLAPVSIGVEESIKPRFGVAAVLLGMAALGEVAGRWHRALAAVVFVGLFAYKWNDERVFHDRFDRRVAEARVGPIAALPRHARVLPASWLRGHVLGETAFHHLADLAVVERDAYLPDLFAAPGQQILRHRRPWSGEVRAPGELTAARLVGFDYVWAQSDDPEALVAGVAGCVEGIAAATNVALYRVRRDTPCAAREARDITRRQR